MANNDLLKEAIADAKAVKETAIANAKLALEESFTPHLKSMLSAKLEEMDKEDVDEGYDKYEEDDVKEEMDPKDDMKEEKEDMDEAKEELDEIIEDIELVLDILPVAYPAIFPIWLATLSVAARNSLSPKWAYLWVI